MPSAEYNSSKYKADRVAPNSCIGVGVYCHVPEVDPLEELAHFYIHFFVGSSPVNIKSEGCCGFPSKSPPVCVRVRSLEYLTPISYKVDRRCWRCVLYASLTVVQPSRLDSFLTLSLPLLRDINSK